MYNKYKKMFLKHKQIDREFISTIVELPHCYGKRMFCLLGPAVSLARDQVY